MTLTPNAVREYDDRPRGETETATFGLGCFWGPEASFGAVEGVVRTRVGYAGGTKSNPSYHALGDHTETVQIDYDPTVVSYTDVLDRVFAAHDPHHQTAATQYQNVVLPATQSQREAVSRYLDANELDGIETRVERLSRFTPAEAYHQKHSLRGRDRLSNVFREAGYDDETIRESPAAAVVNAHAAGHETATSEALGLEPVQTVRFR